MHPASRGGVAEKKRKEDERLSIADGLVSETREDGIGLLDDCYQTRLEKSRGRWASIWTRRTWTDDKSRTWSMDTDVLMSRDEVVNVPGISGCGGHESKRTPSSAISPF